jgi:hypothetical protein
MLPFSLVFEVSLSLLPHFPRAWSRGLVPTLTLRLVGCTDCFPNQPLCDHLCLDLCQPMAKTLCTAFIYSVS